MTIADLNRLIAHIAEFGIDGVELELDQLARFARQRGLAPIPTSVMTDRSSPRVVRERAFASVCRAIASAVREPVREMALAS